MFLTQGRVWQCLGTFVVVPAWGDEGVPGIWAAQQPPGCRMAPTGESDPASNVNSTEAENLFSKTTVVELSVPGLTALSV